MTQEDALNILKTGVNCFLTGEPGSGKSHTLRQYIEYLKDHEIDYAVTASTGIAATHIGGVTIHSWSGIGANNNITLYDIDSISGKEHIVKRINKTKVLIIDEISMLSGSFIDSLDLIIKNVRGISESFGGMQVVFVGDFFQLPPVRFDFNSTDFAFNSRSWAEANIVTLYLEEQHRHVDSDLVQILSAIRNNSLDKSHIDILNSRIKKIEEIKNETKLFTHNKDVDSFNLEKLEKIKGKKYIFEAKTKGSAKLIDGLVRGCLSPTTLELKIGAVVMCTKNNTARSFVNGTIGEVIGFGSSGGYPIIKTKNGNEILIEPMSWQIEEDGKVKAELTQVPLRHAWAITVHKSQGMTLSSAAIDLSKSFEYGQGYVALSRLSSLSALELLGINRNSLRVHNEVLEKDESFKKESKKSESFLLNTNKDEIKKIQEKFIKFCGGTISSVGITSSKNKSTYDETLQMIKDGKNLSSIAKERNLKFSTIIDHTYVLYERGDLTPNEIAMLPNPKLLKEISKIYRAFNVLGSEKLSPIYEYLGGKYPYDDLKLARLIYTVALKR